MSLIQEETMKKLTVLALIAALSPSIAWSVCKKTPDYAARHNLTESQYRANVTK